MSIPRHRRFSDRDMKSYVLALPSQRKKRSRYVPFALLVLVVALGWFVLRFSVSPPGERTDRVVVDLANRVDDKPSTPTLSGLMAGQVDKIPGSTCVEITTNGNHKFTLNTSLDPAFQSWVEGRLKVSMAEGGVVAAMDPHTGRMLALAAFNRNPQSPVAFVWKTYLAASIFKIVTATAAVDEGILTPDSILSFTGRPHTLYRQHLTSESPAWGNHVTLETAFARSINPVFGKIGIYKLGRDKLEKYGSAFLFNQPFPCELPLETAVFSVPEDTLGIAEVASGFNRKTSLSPIQGAWMASVILDDGAAPAPWLVESIEAASGSNPPPGTTHGLPIRVFSPATAREMQRLMEATIRYGTCRRSFAHRNRISYLRPLTFGGKTGNINNQSGTTKYDWFVGYAKGPGVDDDLAIGVLMLHGRKLGHRANVMAFDVMNHYYRERATR